MPARPLDQRRAVLAEATHDDVRRQRGQVADRPDAELAPGRPPSSRRRPTAARSAAARGTSASSPGGTTTSPSGLRRSDAIFATSLVVATPTDTVSPTSARTSSLIRRAIVGPSPNRPTDAGDVEERLVDRDRLDERREPAEDRHDVPARDLVAAPVDRQEDAVRAAPTRPRAATSPSGRRTRAPRSSPPTRRLGRSGRRRPTMTGRPRSSGWSRCSTDAKNASRSTWRIVRCGHARYHRPNVVDLTAAC